MFFWNCLAFSTIQRMLAIWSLVPLPFLKPACTSGSSWFSVLCFTNSRKIKTQLKHTKMTCTVYGEDAMTDWTRQNCFTKFHVGDFSLSDVPRSDKPDDNQIKTFVVVFQSFICVLLFVNPWTATCQASLSFTICRSLVKVMSVVGKALQLSHPLSSPSPPVFNHSQHPVIF